MVVSLLPSSIPCRIRSYRYKWMLKRRIGKSLPLLRRWRRPLLPCLQHSRKKIVYKCRWRMCSSSSRAYYRRNWRRQTLLTAPRILPSVWPSLLSLSFPLSQDSMGSLLVVLLEQVQGKVFFQFLSIFQILIPLLVNQVVVTPQGLLMSHNLVDLIHWFLCFLVNVDQSCLGVVQCQF